MEYNLNGYLNSTDGSGSPEGKGNGRKERKSFRNGTQTSKFPKKARPSNGKSQKMLPNTRSITVPAASARTRLKARKKHALIRMRTNTATIALTQSARTARSFLPKLIHTTSIHSAQIPISTHLPTTLRQYRRMSTGSGIIPPSLPIKKFLKRCTKRTRTGST